MINYLCKELILRPLNHDNIDEVCIECIKGKLTNLRKKCAMGRKGVLELIHRDICRPFPTPTHEGFNCFIIFRDDFSSYGHVFLLKEKSNALDVRRMSSKSIIG